MRKIHFIFLLLLLFSGREIWGQTQEVFINEIVAKNELDTRDERGHHVDWVEIHNPTTQDFNLGGFFLSDDLEAPQKWRIPDLSEETIVPAGGYLVFWLDEKPEKGLLHCNLKLSRKGETVLLYDKDGSTLVDSVTFPELPADVSWARTPDANRTWAFLDPSTPGEPNLAEGLSNITKKPKFSLDDGFYYEPISVAISAKDGAKVYFTRDGSVPIEADSLLYKQPIQIKRTTVIRARAFKEGWVGSEVATRNFFVNEPEYNLPIFAITVDPEWLYGRKGMFLEKNKWRHTERPAHYAYYVNKEKAFSLNGGIKLQGRFSRNFEKKSFTVTAGQRYGNKEIKYKLFNDIERESFDGLVVRADCNYAGHDEDERWEGGDRIRNELIYQVNKQMGSTVIMQAYQPAILILNGRYWGLYNLMERKNKDFIEKHYGVKEMDLVNPAVDRDDGYVFEVYQGSDFEFRRMEGYIKESDMTKKEVYDTLSTLIDMRNFIDDWVYEIYTNKGDPTANSRIWRPTNPPGKWQTIGFDWDHWKEQDKDWIKVFARKRRGKSWLFAELFKNEEFQNAFINRMCDYLNTALSPDNIRRLVWEIHESVKEEKMRDRARWEDDLDFMEWEEQIHWTLHFADERPGYLYQHIATYLDLPGPAEVTIDVAGENMGLVRFSTLEHDRFPWTGTYMQDIPVKLEAVPFPGYKFIGWEDSKLGKDARIEVVIGEENVFRARFAPDPN